MSKDETDVSWKIPSKLAIGVICVLLGTAISFNAWAVASVYERPTSQQVKEMIADKSPYGKDRNLILQSLSDLRKALERNTNTISDLRAAVEQWRTQTLHGR